MPLSGTEVVTQRSFVMIVGSSTKPPKPSPPPPPNPPAPTPPVTGTDLIEPIGGSEEGEQHRTVLTQIDPRIGITGSHHLEQDAFNSRALLLGIALAGNDQEVEPLATLLIHNKMAANLLRSFDIVNRMDDCLDLARTCLEQELHRYRVEGVLERLVTQATLRDGVLRNHIVQLCTNMGNLITRSLHGLEGESQSIGAELLADVLAYGPEAEIIAPESLRRAAAERLRAAAAHYAEYI